ncbi:MAG TPA: hypothetical protein VNC84_06645 [Gammaproteobacteria bacterium]|jgi:hypothetical protein|nr:hypothetical protein [Gammaproteobacteria bacterium]
MEMERHDSIQYVVACMATHAYLAKKIVKGQHRLDDYFSLSYHKKQSLKTFFKEHGDRFLATAMLMEDKRWCDLIDVIRYTAMIIHQNDLKKYWLRYLHQFQLRSVIPGTSLKESILFLTFLLSLPEVVGIKRAVIEYELYKNKALDFDFKEEDNRVDWVDVKKNSLIMHINPSLIMKKFDFCISKIIKNIPLYQSVQSDLLQVSGTEIIVFYKVMQSNIAKVITIQNTLHDILLDISERGFSDKDDISKRGLMNMLFRKNLIYTP